MDPLADNPFFVLGLKPSATAMEVERQGKMLLAKLELGLEAAASYPSPFGRRPRRSDDVRRAMQALSDPERRLMAEAFADAELRDSAAGDDDPAAHGAVDVCAFLWWHPGS